MKFITKYSDVCDNQWLDLLKTSPTATWFQSTDAYRFYSSLPNLFEPFVFGVENDGLLKGIIVGYITKENSFIKQILTRRAIVIGGPALADDITDEELSLLLSITKSELRHKAIYVETRNFNDYSKWRTIFEKCGFKYEPHLNFHVECVNWQMAEKNIGRHRKKYIRLSLRDGATIVENPTLEQIKEYYTVLDELYRIKVRMPLLPFEFFEKLYKIDTCKFLLIEYDGHIVGGSTCVTLKDRGVYEWYACGMDGVYKNIHPSSLTKYAGMKYASENGFKIFDMMGAGKPDEEYGVRDFKAEFGGKLVEHGRFCYVCKPLLYQIGKLGFWILKRIK